MSQQAKLIFLAMRNESENAGSKSENLGIGAGNKDYVVALEFREPLE